MACVRETELNTLPESSESSHPNIIPTPHSDPVARDFAFAHSLPRKRSFHQVSGRGEHQSPSKRLRPNHPVPESVETEYASTPIYVSTTESEATDASNFHHRRPLVSTPVYCETSQAFHALVADISRRNSAIQTRTRQFLRWR